MIAVAVAASGCTSNGLRFNKATLDDPAFELTPEKGDANTIFKVDSLGLGDDYKITWDWGDGQFTYGGTSEHKYGFSNGVMTVTMIATADDGAQGITTRTLTLGSGENKAPTVSLRSTRTWIEVGQTVNVTASGTDADRDPLKYLWTFRGVDEVNERLLPGEGNRIPVAFDEPGSYVVTVRARDPKGGEATSSLNFSVSRDIPDSRFEQTFSGKIVAGTGGAGISDKAWVASPAAPDTNVDATRHRYTLLYPANTLIFLVWNDTSTQGAFDLDLELRSADGTTVFKSETRPPAAPFEFNITQQPPGEYDVIVRGVVGADVSYMVLVQATLQITPELVAAAEGRRPELVAAAEGRG